MSKNPRGRQIEAEIRRVSGAHPQTAARTPPRPKSSRSADPRSAKAAALAEYERLADEAEDLTRRTRDASAASADHLRAARANLAAADAARVLGDADLARGHERLAEALQKRAGELTPRAPAPAVSPNAMIDLAIQAIRPTIRKIGREGRFGTDKVFLSEIWARLSQEPRFGSLSKDQFRAALLRGLRQGDFVLARADLVGAMDKQRVAASEIQDRGSEFHFVLDPDAHGG